MKTKYGKNIFFRSIGFQIQKVDNFVNRVNSKLHSQEQEERLRQISDRIGPFENVSAPPELSSVR